MTMIKVISFFPCLIALSLLLKQYDAFGNHCIGLKRTTIYSAYSPSLLPLAQCNIPYIPKTISPLHQHNMISTHSELLASIEGDTMLSVKKCLDIYQALKTKINVADKTIPLKFIDSSWWHKGDLNGREL